MNEGKRFQEDFKNSVTDDVYHYRLRDGTASWDGGENTRFQSPNACDSLLWLDSMLYMIELKSHKGKSIPYSAIRDNQVEELTKAQAHGITAGFLVNMRDVDETYFIPADAVCSHIAIGDRKSIPLEYMRMYGYKVKASKKITRWRYDIKDMLEKIRIDK